jgi:hypothetical protein
MREGLGSGSTAGFDVRSQSIKIADPGDVASHFPQVQTFQLSQALAEGGFDRGPFALELAHLHDFRQPLFIEIPMRLPEGKRRRRKPCRQAETLALGLGDEYLSRFLLHH